MAVTFLCLLLHISHRKRGRMGEQGLGDYPVKWGGGQSNGDTLFFLLPTACSHHTLSHSLASLFSTHLSVGESVKLILNLLLFFKEEFLSSLSLHLIIEEILLLLFLNLYLLYRLTYCTYCLTDSMQQGISSEAHGSSGSQEITCFCITIFTVVKEWILSLAK
jgi:hypothetical protein